MSKNHVEKRTVGLCFLPKKSYLPIFVYDATHFEAYDNLKKKVEAFISF